MSDPEKDDELEYMKTMFTDDLKFMQRMIKRSKKKLIEVFLKDWRWGRAYGNHFSWLNFYDHCRCKPTIIQYWKWFEKKWEARLRY